MKDLYDGEAFPGIVHDDTAIFSAAQARGLKLLSMKVVLPQPAFQKFAVTLDAERQKSQYSYGFPDGDGDCNCVTWIERLGIPLLAGTLIEFVGLLGWNTNPTRRFGKCR